MENPTTSSATFVVAPDASSDFTHLFGEVELRPAAVVRCFGNGTDSDEFKVSRQWKFKKGDLVFTLYDWKSTNLYDSEMWSPEELWASNEPFPLHIGSKEPATHDDAKEFAQFLCEMTSQDENQKRDGNS